MSRTRPNILFFFTDDQRFNTLNALGNPEIITPVMDRLVAQGTAFTHAHVMGGCVGAICMPSRAMLMTGRTLFHIEKNGSVIPEAHRMFPEHFRAQGYATFGTGKWHNGTDAYARCFSDGGENFFGGMSDHWNVPASHFRPDGNYPEAHPLRERRGNLVAGFNACYDHFGRKHSSELFCDEAIDFLDNRRPNDRPFCAYVSFMAPHDPREMPGDYLTMYDPDALTLPENFMTEHPFDNGELRIRDELLAPFPRTEAEIRRHLCDYYAMITHADAQMGRVLEALKRTGEMDNTIIVFAGDNGLAVGCHGLMGKQNLYEHSTRVPLVMAGPGVPVGARSAALCYLLDIFPTLCDLAGFTVPESVEGRSLLPVMRGEQAGRDALFLAYKNIHRGIRTRTHKLIEYNVNGTRMTQLFDLVQDPFELKNLAASAGQAELLGKLRERLVELAAELNDPAGWVENITKRSRLDNECSPNLFERL